MTASRYGRSSVALALSTLVAGIAYQIVGMSQDQAGIALWLGAAAVCLCAAMAVHVQPADAPPAAVRVSMAGRSVRPAARRHEPGVVNVDRADQAHTWTTLLTGPLEGLAVAWTIGVLVFLLILPVAAIGAAIALLLRRF